MKLAFIFFGIVACTSLFASSSKVECLKNAKKAGKSMEQAYQLCSVKSK